MRRTTVALAVAVLAVLPSAVLSARADDVPATEKPKEAEPEWVADFDKAVEKAKAEKKDLLVDFTGSDWCGWCIKLHDEVFSQPEFFPVAKEFILVSLDFPHGAEALARVPNMARNKELAEKHEVQGYPTVLLMTAEGDVYGQTGYQPGGAAKYLTDVLEMRKTGKPALLEATALVKDFEAAKEADRPAVLGKLLTKLESAKEGATWAAKLMPSAREAVKLDPENKSGLAIRGLRALLTASPGTEDDRAAARKLDPKNEEGVLELVVRASMSTVRDEDSCRAAFAEIEALDALGTMKNKTVACVLYANAAFWNHRFLANADAAKKYAKKLEAIADPKDPRFAPLLKEILGSKDSDKDAKEGDGDAPAGPEKDAK